MYGDKIDDKIVKHLKEDSKITASKLGRKVGLSEATIRRRIKRMVDEKIIKRFTVEMNQDEDTTNAIVLVSVDSTTDTSKVSTKITKFEGVKNVYEITGQHDIATIIGADNILGINATIDELRKITGVIDTNTVIILRKIA